MFLQIPGARLQGLDESIVYQDANKTAMLFNGRFREKVFPSSCAKSYTSSRHAVRPIVTLFTIEVALQLTQPDN